MDITPSLLASISRGARPDRLEALSPAIDLALAEFLISDPLEVAYFLAQTAHETGGFVRLRESFAYRSERLGQVFSVFRKRPELVTEYAGRPEALASFVYAGKLGNGPESSGDGWRYRGGGLIQLTGRALYAEAGQALGLELEAHPELIEQPINAARTAGWYWQQRCRVAVEFGFDAVSRRINPGESPEHRRTYLRAALVACGLGDLTA